MFYHTIWATSWEKLSLEVCHQVRLKPAQLKRLARLEVLALAIIGIILIWQRTTKALISLRIRTSVVRIWHKTGFLMTWLIYRTSMKKKKITFSVKDWCFPKQSCNTNVSLTFEWYHCSQRNCMAYTVNFLNIRTPKIFVVIILKFELCGSTIE